LLKPPPEVISAPVAMEHTISYERREKREERREKREERREKREERREKREERREKVTKDEWEQQAHTHSRQHG
jgi:hypothetical protein